MKEKEKEKQSYFEYSKNHKEDMPYETKQVKVKIVIYQLK